MEMTMAVKPYDYDVVDDLTSILLWDDLVDRGDGYMDIPAATIQLGINILESARNYMVDLTDDISLRREYKETIVKAMGTLNKLKWKQQKRESERGMNA